MNQSQWRSKGVSEGAVIGWKQKLHNLIPEYGAKNTLKADK